MCKNHRYLITHTFQLNPKDSQGWSEMSLWWKFSWFIMMRWTSTQSRSSAEMEIRLWRAFQQKAEPVMSTVWCQNSAGTTLDSSDSTNKVWLWQLDGDSPSLKIQKNHLLYAVPLWDKDVFPHTFETRNASWSLMHVICAMSCWAYLTFKPETKLSDTSVQIL